MSLASRFWLTSRPCTPDVGFRQNNRFGIPNKNIPTERSTFFLSLFADIFLLHARSPHNTARDGSRIYLGLAFHSPTRVRRGSCQYSNRFPTFPVLRLDQSFQDITPTFDRAFRRLFENAIFRSTTRAGSFVIRDRSLDDACLI